MVEVNIIYEGQLRCRATHEPSKTTLITDAPKDNHGKGESFSPTDLVATALGSCMLTVMGLAEKTMGLDLRGAKITVNKEMIRQPIRRIGTLAVKIDIPLKLNDEQKQKLTEIIMSCPVHHSLHPDINAPVEFNWA